MTEILKNRLDAVAQACIRHGATRLDVFGSALRDDFKPGQSDVDLLVELGPMEPYARVDAYSVCWKTSGKYWGSALTWSLQEP